MKGAYGQQIQCFHEKDHEHEDNQLNHHLQAIEGPLNRREDIIQLSLFLIAKEEQNKGKMLQFFHGTLGGLVDYDKGRGGELVRTLGAYFEFNGNVRSVSNALYTHYNTIPCRLQRIQEITGMNLESEDDRYCLHTALKIKRHLNL